jgi:hypothetical protein
MYRKSCNSLTSKLAKQVFGEGEEDHSWRIHALWKNLGNKSQNKLGNDELASKEKWLFSRLQNQAWTQVENDLIFRIRSWRKK